MEYALKIAITGHVSGLALPSSQSEAVRCLWSLHAAVWGGGAAASGLLPSCSEAAVPSVNATVVLPFQKKDVF